MSRLSPGTTLPSPRRVLPRPVAWRRAELTLSRVPRIRQDVRRISWPRIGGSIRLAAPGARGTPAEARRIRCPDLPRPRPGLSQAKFATAQVERTAGTVRGLFAALGFEPWIPGALFEHHGKRDVLDPQRLVQRHAGRPGEVRRARVRLHGGQRPAGPRVRRALTAGVPEAVPGGQDAVPRSPAETKRPHMIARLIEIPRVPRRTGRRHFPLRSAAHRIPPRAEGRGPGREIW